MAGPKTRIRFDHEGGEPSYKLVFTPTVQKHLDRGWVIDDPDAGTAEPDEGAGATDDPPVETKQPSRGRSRRTKAASDGEE